MESGVGCVLGVAAQLSLMRLTTRQQSARARQENSVRAPGLVVGDVADAVQSRCGERPLWVRWGCFCLDPRRQAFDPLVVAGTLVNVT